MQQFLFFQDINDLVEEALLSDSRLIVLSAMLEQNFPIKVTLHLLTRLMRYASDQVVFFSKIKI